MPLNLDLTFKDIDSRGALGAFGTGDIDVWPGKIQDKPCIIFTQREPTEIGIKSTHRDDFDTVANQFILLTFEKPESIDVLIEALNHIKTNNSWT